MEGSETGWGRPAEPAPRWRALIDRARLAGRGAEQPEPDRRVEDPLPPPRPLTPPEPLAPPEPLPRRAAHNGYAGRAPAAGQPERTYGVQPGERAYGADPGYRAEGTYRVDPSYRAEPAYRSDPGHPGEPAHRVPEQRRPEPPESRYSLLDNGYRSEPRPAESRYALLENGYRPEASYPAPPAVPPAPPAPVPPPPASPALAPPPVVADRTYSARAEWRPPAPDPEVERARAVLRREFGSPRVIAFANPKGGVHKTTATVLAAATVGSVRGRGVLAWDDNELRGTLGLRAGSARHARTIRHLITELAQIEILEGDTLLDRLDDFLRHASDGSYDVLAGEESPRFAQRLDQFTVRRVLELLRRTHEVVCVDTGNNVESPNWRTVMQAADQLVVTTVPREDAAFSADWMLDLLHEVGMGELAENAVTLISCPTPGRSQLQDDLERHFASRTRAVAVVPYDPALETGSSIEYAQLQPETRQAWLRAAAVMLEPFAR
ncbi:MinD/ParA family ATP-binding protein [Micromonospora avicenniae]|uniref:MinD-like ATPase involved in chromosome partitioning or flagellar assembly n=1 Tax=Micromonospora avicenniae TaxID=1198245 RepID=A0A1N6SGY5_9ACTN|nr:AAA family ATPase [Micromonospora avicenniae]SIQ40279.1 MinD-like ATPase involved in chromosome partitioning or flagellar assembly [Micromonospora avicenniae]